MPYDGSAYAVISNGPVIDRNLFVRIVLKLARQSLIDPRKWIKGAGLRFASGRVETDETKCNAADVTGYCAAYAIIRAAGGYNQIARDTAERLAIAIGGSGAHDIPDWNDAKERTHDEVIAAFDRAIAAT